MAAQSVKKSSKKNKKVKKTKRSIEQPVNPEGTKRIKPMAPILRSQKRKTTSTTITTSSPLVNSNDQPRRQNNNRGNFNGNSPGAQQNSRGEPVSKQGFIAEGGPYGKKNEHQGTISISSGSQPKLKPRVTLPPIKTAEEQENHNNLMKEALQKGSSQGSFDEQRIKNEQLGVTTHEYDPRDTMPTPIPTTTGAPSTSTSMPVQPNPYEAFFQNSENLKYPAYGLGIILFIATLIFFKKRLMCCFCAPFRWIWSCIQRIRGKRPNTVLTAPIPPLDLSSQSKKECLDCFKKRDSDTEVLVPPDEPINRQNRSRGIPTTSRTSSGPSEIQRLVKNETIGSPTKSEFEKTLEDLREAGKEIVGSMNQNPPIIKNNEEQKFDNDVKEYEDSLKPTVEDEEKAKKIEEQLENLDGDIKRMKKEMKEKEEQHRRDTSSDAGDFAEADEIDRKFREDMDRQNREFQEKMEELRKQRREKQRIADEEFQELRRQMQLRIAAILACMQLKQRFIEKKEEWEDFLKKLRELLVKIINSYYDLQKEIKNFDSTDEFSQSCLDSEAEMFAKKVANAQHMFSNAFNNLKTLTENYDDRIFIKMIMKSISKQAHLCNDVGEELVKVLESKSKDIRKLDESVSRIDSQEIPTTGRLTKESVHAREEDYANIEDVSLPEWFRYFM